MHREPDGEHRAAIWVVGGVDPPAVQACVLLGDGQPQTAALRARPGTVGLVEPVEDVPHGPGGNAGAVVTDLQDQFTRRPPGRPGRWPGR